MLRLLLRFLAEALESSPIVRATALYGEAPLKRGRLELCLARPYEALRISVPGYAPVIYLHDLIGRRLVHRVCGGRRQIQDATWETTNVEPGTMVEVQVEGTRPTICKFVGALEGRYQVVVLLGGEVMIVRRSQVRKIRQKGIPTVGLGCMCEEMK